MVRLFIFRKKCVVEKIPLVRFEAAESGGICLCRNFVVQIRVDQCRGAECFGVKRDAMPVCDFERKILSYCRKGYFVRCREN